MISIVTGTLNRIHMLPDLIKNTVENNDKIELVLVDGGSTDGTLDYVKKLNHPRIKLVEVGQRSSYPHFMNLGIEHATHDWICQWNDDALLVCHWQDVIAELDKNHDFYLFNWKYGSHADLTNDSWLSGHTGDNGWCICYTVKKDHDNGEIVVNYGVYSKKIFREIGMYNPEYRYYYCDGDMAYRAYSFGYAYKTLDHVKVCSIYEPKTALHYVGDKEIYDKNLNLYKRKILPNSIIKLK